MFRVICSVPGVAVLAAAAAAHSLADANALDFDSVSNDAVAPATATPGITAIAAAGLALNDLTTALYVVASDAHTPASV